jgi:hypothetical protein
MSPSTPNNCHGKIKPVITDVSSMPRRSLAEDLDDGDDVEEDGEWLMIYDFEGRKTSKRFWENLSRLAGISSGGTLIQRSVFFTSSQRVATVSKRLAAHYGAKTAVFKVL